VQTLIFIVTSFFTSPFWSAIFGAVIGGLITGWFVLKAQKQEAKERREADRQTEREEVKAVLQAFAAELKSFEKGFVHGLDEAFGNWEKEPYRRQVPLNLPPVNQNYFTVYDGNGVALGRIVGAELREKIIGTYSQAKSVIDAVNYNNKRYLEWDRVRHGVGHDPSRSQQIAPDLIKWADETIRERIKRVKEVLPGLLADIERYSAS
jgi:hypothetical protein